MLSFCLPARRKKKYFTTENAEVTEIQSEILMKILNLQEIPWVSL